LTEEHVGSGVKQPSNLDSFSASEGTHSAAAPNGQASVPELRSAPSPRCGTASNHQFGNRFSRRRGAPKAVPLSRPDAGRRSLGKWAWAQIGRPQLADVIDVAVSSQSRRRPLLTTVKGRSAARPRKSEKPARRELQPPRHQLESGVETVPMETGRWFGSRSRYGARSQAEIRRTQERAPATEAARPALRLRNHFPFRYATTDDFVSCASLVKVQDGITCFPWWIRPAPCAFPGRRN